ncbi:MAG TPA: cyclic nucleotide-binding domain-containing protein [Dehalococcoidia bacterium]|nr:cyclic nucleotide-binding domain-containing protein [Dehalococcoidia bacterium]
MAISADQKVKRLEAIPIFAHANRRQLEHVAAIADEVDVPKGTVLAKQGERGLDFFVIEDGKARVVADGQQMAELGPGDFFGEISLIDGGPRTATVEAAADMKLLIVRKPSFDDLMETSAELRGAVVRALGQRIRELDENAAQH